MNLTNNRLTATAGLCAAAAELAGPLAALALDGVEGDPGAADLGDGQAGGGGGDGHGVPLPDCSAAGATGIPGSYEAAM